MRIRLPLMMLPPDTYERHSLVAQHLQREGTTSVLDVGGEGLLRRFLRGVKCVSTNVDDSGDVQYDGVRLPFGSASFDAVVTLDTIEHVPGDQRQGLVNELRRVAQHQVVLCAPYGSAFHRDLEQRAFDLYQLTYGRENTYLREHLECGLPDADELHALFSGMRHQVLFCGDCEQQYARFASRCGRTSAEPSALASLLELARDGNYWRRHRLHSTATDRANRIYVFAQVGE